MGIEIFNTEDQASGNFNYGEILENKPIGFPQDSGKLKPYSSLFYWAHAWTPSIYFSPPTTAILLQWIW